jgi:hypothetical protein
MPSVATAVMYNAQRNVGFNISDGPAGTILMMYKYKSMETIRAK